MQWVPMQKGVAYLFRYQEVSRQANSRYLNALAVVDDPSPAIDPLDEITTREELASGRGVRAFNALSRADAQRFKAMMAGDPKRQSAMVSRILTRFHAHRLIVKIPRARRWRVTDRVRRVMAASLHLRDFAFPQHYANTAAA